MVQSRNPLPEWPLLSLSFSMAPCFLSLLLPILLSATAGGQHHDHWGHHFARHKSATFDAPSTQICQACKNVCESILSDSDSLTPHPSPFDSILVTANAFAAGLQTARSMIQSILDASEKALNINRINTACICLEVLSYSDRRLSAAFSTALPASAIGDVVPGPAPPSSTSTTASPALSKSTTLPRSPTPWPSPPSPTPALVFRRPSVRPIRVEQAASIRSIWVEKAIFVQS